MIQLASALADHAHSGCAATTTVAVPPLALTLLRDVAVTWHFSGDGPDVAVLLVHAALNTNAAIAAATPTRQSITTCAPARD